MSAKKHLVLVVVGQGTLTVAEEYLGDHRDSKKDAQRVATKYVNQDQTAYVVEDVMEFNKA